MLQKQCFWSNCNKSIRPSCTECSAVLFSKAIVPHSQQAAQLVHFSRSEPVCSCPCCLTRVCRWHLQGRVTQVQRCGEVLGMCAVLQAGSAPGCSLLFSFVPWFIVSVLSLSAARAVFGLSASISEPRERLFRAVCQNPCGQGAHPWVCFPDVWSCYCQLLNAGGWGGRDV